MKFREKKMAQHQVRGQALECATLSEKFKYLFSVNINVINMEIGRMDDADRETRRGHEPPLSYLTLPGLDRSVAGSVRSISTLGCCPRSDALAWRRVQPPSRISSLVSAI
jgi:hypothetical protein